MLLTSLISLIQVTHQFRHDLFAKNVVVRCGPLNSPEGRFVLSLATFLALVFVNYLLHRAAKNQYVSTLITAFQDEWHDRSSILMRAALQRDDFKQALNRAISKAYGENIDYTEISNLLKPSEQASENGDSLAKFEDELLGIIYVDHTTSGKRLFSAYEALYRVLLTFDRLAIMRNERTAWKKFIKAYRPPIRDLAKVLQAFIAVRIAFRESKYKNYKKDYLQLLHMLGVNEQEDKQVLYDFCKKGLKDRSEWTIMDSYRGRRRRCFKKSK